jgi:hypothetical protein
MPPCGPPDCPPVFQRWSLVKHRPPGRPPAAIMFHELLQTTGRVKRPHETVRGRERRLQACGITRLSDVHLCCPAGSPCRTGKGKVAIQYHTARFRLVPQLAKALSVPTPAVRKPGSAWTELPRPMRAGAEPAGHVRLGYARASTARQSLDAQLDLLGEAGVTRAFSRATKRPELDWGAGDNSRPRPGRRRRSRSRRCACPRTGRGRTGVPGPGPGR